jgi:Fe-S-cluster containining protein
MSTHHSPKELLWLSCRQKRCCYTTRVVLTGHDLQRICVALEVEPWDVACYAPAADDVADGFQLTPGGRSYQLLLNKRGKVGARGAPCSFLWKLKDGHAQCGLGALRPAACQSYPALLINDTLCVDSSACTCRRWSLLDLDPIEEQDRLQTWLATTAHYADIVAAWNRSIQGPHAFQDYCLYLLNAYREEQL